MGRVDMHIHSIYSDGELTPLQILDICNTKGIKTLSITDHDNLKGTKEAISENPYNNINVIPGIELSAHYPKGQLHILGYGVSLNNKDLNKITSDIMQDNVNRIKSLVKLLYDYYKISFNDKDLEAVFSKEGNIGRPEIAKLCVKYGYADNVQHAFKYLFSPLKNKLTQKIKLSDLECIEYIKNAGGISSLAHSITLRKSDYDLDSYFKLLKSYGLDAIEVYHSDHTTEYSKKLVKLADKYEFLQSGGSDYHGPIVKPDIKIGTGKNNNLDINNLSILSKLVR